MVEGGAFRWGNYRREEPTEGMEIPTESWDGMNRGIACPGTPYLGGVAATISSGPCRCTGTSIAQGRAAIVEFAVSLWVCCTYGEMRKCGKRLSALEGWLSDQVATHAEAPLASEADTVLLRLAGVRLPGVEALAAGTAGEMQVGSLGLICRWLCHTKGPPT